MKKLAENPLFVFLSGLILIAVVCVAAGCKKENNVPKADADDFDYVDLGLPSGTLWAKCNVGANRPEDVGDYFAWGETETKDKYDWKNYKYSAVEDNIYKLNKYCTDSSMGFDGFVDGLTVLEPVDDAAFTNGDYIPQYPKSC